MSKPALVNNIFLLDSSSSYNIQTTSTPSNVATQAPISHETVSLSTSDYHPIDHPDVSKTLQETSYNAVGKPSSFDMHPMFQDTAQAKAVKLPIKDTTNDNVLNSTPKQQAPAMTSGSSAVYKDMSNTVPFQGYNSLTKTSYEIGLPQQPALVTAEHLEPRFLPSYISPLKEQIQKIIETQKRPVTSDTPLFSPKSDIYLPFASGDGFEAWSPFSSCSVSCGVGTRQRTRICRTGNKCYGSTFETEPCINEQCACKFSSHCSIKVM